MFTNDDEVHYAMFTNDWSSLFVGYHRCWFQGDIKCN